MRLFSGSVNLFISKALNNEIAPTLQAAFLQQMGHKPSPSEIRSWENSLKDVAFTIQIAELDDVGVILELRLPMTSKRLDVMFTGRGLEDARSRAVIMELKQWQKADSTGFEDLVQTNFFTKDRLDLHPSRQAATYAEHLRDQHTAFYSDEGQEWIELTSCSYLHNANTKNCGGLLDPQYARTLEESPMFMGNQRDELQTYLVGQVGGGDGVPIMQRGGVRIAAV